MRHIYGNTCQEEYYESMCFLIDRLGLNSCLSREEHSKVLSVNIKNGSVWVHFYTLRVKINAEDFPLSRFCLALNMLQIGLRQTSLS